MDKNVLFSIVLLAGLPLFAQKISGDISGDNLSNDAVMVAVSPIDQKTGPVADYSIFLLKTLSRDPKAIGYLISAVEKDPENKEYLRILQAAAHRKIQTADRRRIIVLAEKNKTNPQLVMLASEMLVAENNVEKALTLLTDMLCSHMDNLSAYSKKEQLETLVRLCIAVYLPYRKNFNEKIDHCFRIAMENPNFEKRIGLFASAYVFYDRAAKDMSGESPFLMGWLIASDREKYQQNAKKAKGLLLKNIKAKEKVWCAVLEPLIAYLYKEKRTEELDRLTALLQTSYPDQIDILELLYYTTEKKEIRAQILEKTAKWDGKRQITYSEHIGSAYKDHAFAIDILNQIIPGKNKELANDVHLRLSTLYFYTGHYDEAMKNANLLPETADSEMLISQIYAVQKKYEKALTHCEKYIKLLPKNSKYLDSAIRSAAFYAEFAGKIDVAEKYLLPVLEKNPKDVEILNMLGYMWTNHNIKLDQAEKLLRRAVELEPENEAVLDSLAWCLYKRGNHVEAQMYIIKSIAASKTKSNGTILDHAGDIFLKNGDTKTAIRFWKDALKNPDFELEPEKVKAKLQKYESLLQKEK